ncbi:MAG: hypothetical protein AAGI53_06870 [Planctomycetota bacterium]
MNSSGGGADFQERLARGTIVALLATFGPATAWVLLDPTSPMRAAVAWIGATVGVIAISIGTSIYASIRSPEERDDERDHLIQLRAAAPSGVVLGIAAVVAAVGIIAQQFAVNAGIDAWWTHRLFPAHLLMVSLVVAEMVQMGSVIASYKVGR